MKGGKMRMNTDEIQNQFKNILYELKGIEGLTAESSIQVAQVILQESGKDRRAELLRDGKTGNNKGSTDYSGDMPATLKQKNALTRFGIKFRNDISKSEASELLDKAFGN
jgi:hypothetical protein